MEEDINKLWKVDLKRLINKELDKLHKPELKQMLIIVRKIDQIFLGSTKKR